MSDLRLEIDTAIVHQGRMFKRGKKLNRWHGRQVALKKNGDLVSQKIGRQLLKKLITITKGTRIPDPTRGSVGYVINLTDEDNNPIELKVDTLEVANEWVEAMRSIKNARVEIDTRLQHSPKFVPDVVERPLELGVRLDQRPPNIAPLAATNDNRSGWYKNAYAKQVKFIVDDYDRWTPMEVTDLVVQPNVMRACMGTIQGLTGWYTAPDGRRVYYEVGDDGSWKRGTPPAMGATMGTVQGENGWYTTEAGEASFCRKTERGDWQHVRAVPCW